MENLKRLPTADACIRIEPSGTDRPSESDVAVEWRQQLLPFRVSLNLDDSGSKATGKYQGALALAADNLLGLSDMFYVSYGRGLGHEAKPDETLEGRPDSGSNSYSFHYSVPAGNGSGRRNTATTATVRLLQNYSYSGKSRSSSFGTDYTFYRDARRRSSAGFKLWQRETQTYIDDAEIDVQHRRTAGWSAHFDHREYIGRSTLTLGLDYKRGTGRNHSLSAPEEAFGGGTSRMQTLTADIGAGISFCIGGQTFAYDTAFRRQWNFTPLTLQEQMSLGRRYSIRGFDGEQTLLGERGWQWCNTLGWQYLPSHQVYLAADSGGVGGGRNTGASSLSGGAVGLKGRLKAGGVLSYDVFAGRPFRKPDYLQTASPVYGFNLNYSF
ncbi:ShlB/FhaC/HecB family hemolysin secretion/activation protein [Neisseria chenwenguii]|uniref:ShlB/FhaC/HecB family hemolysin secretion/activation protein n=1 Tax=Neisseria chenwenguii TaxID=1853278 RepID=UPI0013153D61|nr:ShlB/FhaC/HecB family hemolysin secretion/activation protein [Neisseria chenwenguii]